TTKLANILFAKQLQHVLDEQGINATSISLHPGGVSTDFIQSMRTSSTMGYILYSIVKTLGLFVTPAQGAYTSLFAATSPQIHSDKRKYAGVYLVPNGVLAEPSKEARDPVAAQDSWATSEMVASSL
ncbi:hypothetical protein FRB98_003165, partial [Tulasnella sp. 332]